MKRYAYIDPDSGHVLGVADADTPEGGAMLVAEKRQGPGRYAVRSLTAEDAEDSGFYVHRVPDNWKCRHGDNEHKIAAAEACPFVAALQVVGLADGPDPRMVQAA